MQRGTAGAAPSEKGLRRISIDRRIREFDLVEIWLSPQQRKQSNFSENTKLFVTNFIDPESTRQELQFDNTHAILC